MIRRVIAALMLLLAGTVATAQVPFPQTLPPNTVYGRLGISAGPGQAVPFAVLTQNLLLGPVNVGPSDGINDGAIFGFKVVSDAVMFSSATSGSGAHSFPQFVIRSRDTATPSGAGGVLRFDSPNSVGAYKASVQLNGGLVDATNGSEQGDLDFVILRNGAFAIPLALRGDSSALLPSVSDIWDIGTTSTGRYKNLFLSRTANLGLAGTATGQLLLNGTTSGTVTVQPQAAAGTFNFNLPTGAGSSGNILLSGGGAASPMTWSGCTIDGNNTLSCSSAAANQPQYNLTNTTNSGSSALFIWNKNRAGGNTTSGDTIGGLIWQGFANSAQQNTARLLVTQTATSSGSNIPSNIILSTSNTAGQLNQTWTFNEKGHMAITASAAPTLTAGCNGAGNAVTGNNVHGTATGQTAAATTCTLTFANSGFSTVPDCVVSGLTSPLTGTITPATTTLVVNFASTANYKFTWHCFGL